MADMATDVANKLETLQKPTQDECFFAFGPGDRYFWGTSNGYAIDVPPLMADAIRKAEIQKITWVSFGSESDSWFLAYELRGTSSYVWGQAVPSGLLDYIKYLMPNPNVRPPPFLRIVLGHGSSYVAWTNTSFTYEGIPHGLKTAIRDWSNGKTLLGEGIWEGNRPALVTWNRSDSYFAWLCCHSDTDNRDSRWQLKDGVIHRAWEDMWGQEGREEDALMHITLHPHRDPLEGGFVFLKKTRTADGMEEVVPYVSITASKQQDRKVHGEKGQDPKGQDQKGRGQHSIPNQGKQDSPSSSDQSPRPNTQLPRVPLAPGWENFEDAIRKSDNDHLVQMDAIREQQRGQQAVFIENQSGQHRVIIAAKPKESTENAQPQTYKDARALHHGRAHKNDPLELSLHKGENLKVLEEKGDWWCIVENNKGEQGWAPRAWLEMSPEKRVDSTGAYKSWKQKAEQVLSKGLRNGLTAFPDLPTEVGFCALTSCETAKQDPEGIGLCVHDVQEFLSASEDYSYAFLRDERVKWHPDRFGIYCHPDYRDEGKKKAEILFVILGMLMDMEQNRTGEA